MQITILGHASTLIESKAARVLVDPIFADTFASDTLRICPARDIDVEVLASDLSALVITHAHLDHFHPPTLARLSKRIPVIVPPHDFLVGAVRELGFEQVIPLPAWDRISVGPGGPDGSLELLITPSDFEWDELGVVASSPDASYWHMSDSIVTREVGARVRREVGRISLVAAKFAPLRTVIGYQRGVQSMMLDRDEIVDGFEAACAAEPAAMFPYAFGFAYAGEHAWANRHIGPYSPDEVAALFKRRLGSACDTFTVRPGDVLTISGRTVTRKAASAGFVREKPSAPVQPWEPIDPSTLAGLPSTACRDAFSAELDDLVRRGVFPWVRLLLERRAGMFDAYHELQAVWQGVVHVSPNDRLHYAIDFREPEPPLYLGLRHPEANVFSHVSAGHLHRVLRGQAGAELFWMAGGYRQYEKLLMIRDGRFAAPEQMGWELFEQLPDPLTQYLRKVGTERLVA
ncbi:MAG: MBL fold metallo-hydrolase [Myxococcales bacterium]|nr:MBL fold metallo-hydrolase [Myxococcales bacterium]